MSLNFLLQNPAILSHPTLNQLGFDRLGASLWHAAFPDPWPSRKEENPTEHWAPHHAAYGSGLWPFDLDAEGRGIRTCPGAYEWRWLGKDIMEQESKLRGKAL
jgi:hypothetical protein